MDMNQWARYTEERTYEAGEYVFRQGDPGTEMMIIKEGQVMITKEAEGAEALVLGYRSEGDTLGEIAVVRQGPRTASVVAIVPTVMLVLNTEAFTHLLRTDPHFQDVLLSTLIELLLDADQDRVQYASSELVLFDQIASLSDDQRRLAELMHLRHETIHFIVHDLRNPINLAHMALSMLELGDNNPEDTERFLTMARTGLDRMLRLVDSMLDVERLDGGEADLDFSETDLNDVMEVVGEAFRPAALSHKVDLVVDVPGPLPTMAIDRVRIERVITNLADNAFKFTPPGGAVTIGAMQREDDVVMWVNDTGPGIPEEERERIFARFAQTEAGRTAKGFGLGLAFCRSAVVAHGGEIWVEEGADGTGTRFVFTLPFER